MKILLVILSILIFSACASNNNKFNKLFDGNNWEAINKMETINEKNK